MTDAPSEQQQRAEALILRALHAAEREGAFDAETGKRMVCSQTVVLEVLGAIRGLIFSDGLIAKDLAERLEGSDDRTAKDLLAEMCVRLTNTILVVDKACLSTLGLVEHPAAWTGTPDSGIVKPKEN